MYKFARDVIIVECSILKNEDFLALMIYGKEFRAISKIKSISRKNGNCYIDGECIGRYLRSITHLGKKVHIYFKIIPEKKIKPEQTVLLPTSQCFFDFRIYDINNVMNSKIIYKRLML